MPEIVDARSKKFFEDPTLPRNAVFAVRFVRDGNAVVEHYANLYFWKKLRPSVGPLLAPLASVKTTKKNWSITLVKRNQHDALTITDKSGLSTGEAEALKSLVASKIGDRVDSLKGRGRDRVLPRDERGVAIKPKKTKPPKIVLVHRPNSVPVKVKVSMQAKPKERPIKTMRRELEKLDREAERIGQMSDPFTSQRPEDTSDPFRNCTSTEPFIVKNYERPAHALSETAWSLFWQLNHKRLPADFVTKYKTQIDRAQNANTGIGAFAALRHILPASSIVHGRVMLERPRDYLQDLVDLGCEPEALGTVTYNPLMRKVNVSRSVYLNEQDLTRLPFAFGKVGGDFWCSDNRLTSLEGAPSRVGGDFWCSYNRLTSLEGAPREVGRSFWCSDNRLTSLEGAPTKVGGDFGCSADDLQDVSALKGCKIGGTLYLYGPKDDWARVKKMLMDQGYRGKIEYGE